VSPQYHQGKEKREETMFHLMPDYPSDSSPIRDWPEDKHKFCNAPRIFIGFNPKGSSDSEPAKSPTSPLDIKTFSGVGITHCHENSIDSQLSSPKKESETIPIGSPHGFTKSTHHTGMEHSESYTCVISHGSKSSTKNMYTRCGMECEIVQYTVQKQNDHEIWDVASPSRSYSNVPVFPVAHFLSACYLCKRQLSRGKDIYMYRGDKAFCSVECRSQQILMDDGMLLPTDFDG
jgi:hypothetical protein